MGSFCCCCCRKKDPNPSEKRPFLHNNQDHHRRASDLSTTQNSTLGTLQPGVAAPSPMVNDRMMRMSYKEEDFELLKRIGKGGFGEVFLARHKATNKCFALKTMEKTLIDEDRQIDVFIERDIMKKLGHPNVLRLYGTFQSDTHLFYLMDYCAGGDMVKFLEKIPEGRVSLVTARNWAAQAWLAVTFMHANGVIYRDLKPENILLTREGSLVMADFGLSKPFTDQQDLLKAGADSVVGSPFYIAPEILDQKKYDHSVDWWSYGVLLFRLIYGMNPFTGRNKRQLFDSIRNDPVNFAVAPRVANDRHARDLITRLLVKDPKHRMKSMEISSHPFFEDVNWSDLADGRIPMPREWKIPQSADQLLQGHNYEVIEPKMSQMKNRPAEYQGFSTEKRRGLRGIE